MWIKLSDLPVEADLDNWTEADLRPYIAATLDAFGTERTIFAGDYPILHAGDDDDRNGSTCSTAPSPTSACPKPRPARSTATTPIRFYRLACRA